jgi:hypothetical protein
MRMMDNFETQLLLSIREYQITDEVEPSFNIHRIYITFQIIPILQWFCNTVNTMKSEKTKNYNVG